MSRKDLSDKIKQRLCPPGILFTAEYSGKGSRKLSCKITINGATQVEAEHEEVYFNIKASVQAGRE